MLPHIKTMHPDMTSKVFFIIKNVQSTMLQSFAALLRDFLTSNNEEIASIYKKWQGLGRISKARRITC